MICIVPLRDDLIHFSIMNHKTFTEAPLEEKLYQLIISRLDGDQIGLQGYQKKIVGLVRKGICGFIVFGGERDEIKSFVDAVQSISSIPLLISSDIERGVGQQIRGCTAFPCQMAVAAATERHRSEDVLILESALKAIADEARYIGINMPLIPVLDVNKDPDNPIICTRAFSDDPEIVSRLGKTYIRILEGEGLVTCAKHFPGHGDTSSDSHITLPVIDKTYEELMHSDIIPFKEAIRQGVGSIMIGHLSVPAVDSKPATLSKRMITSVLRESLGFKGLILTDALTMHALNDIAHVPLRCINAGVDILLHPVDPDAAVRELSAASLAGELAEERINESLGRILRLKEKLRYGATEEIEYPVHRSLSSQITDMSVSLIKNTKGILPIPENGNIQLICAGDEKYFNSTLLRDLSGNILRVHENDLVFDLHNKVAIFAVFTSVTAWRGSSGVSNEETNRIREFIKKAGKSIVISFGSPYVLRHFTEADVLIAAYEETEQAQRAVLKCLKGAMDFKGRLPVKIFG